MMQPIFVRARRVGFMSWELFAIGWKLFWMGGIIALFFLLGWGIMRELRP